MASISQQTKLGELVFKSLQLVIINHENDIGNFPYKSLSYLRKEIIENLDTNNGLVHLYQLVSEGKNEVMLILSEWNDYKNKQHRADVLNSSSATLNNIVTNLDLFESNINTIKTLFTDAENELNPFIINHLLTKTETVENEQKNTSKLISDQSSEFNINLSNYKKDYEYYSKLNVDSHRKLTNELIKTANDSELSLGKKVPELTKQIETELESTIIEKSNEIELLRKTVEADEIAFRSLFKEMKKLYKIAGDGKLSDQNIKQADEEKIAADKMRYFGVGLLFVLIGFASWFLVLLTELPANTSYLSWFLPRFLTLTFCSMPAIYLLKESASHRHKENLYRQRGTQLATLGSYLADFNNDDKRMDVKSELIKNFYSFNDGKADTSNVPDFIKQMKEFAAVTKTFNKMAPAEKIPSQQAQSTQVTSIHEVTGSDNKNNKSNTQ